ncbi:MAG: RNA polymerase sigma factor [Methylacidiphilales bacterium]|nr:RNA polymerase sigma factor [Candidatus Methylacidiphilales bacterium]
MAVMVPNPLEQVYDRHAGALFAFLLNLTCSEPDTRDLLQELFLKLARKPGLLAKAQNERSFLYRTAHNLFIDHYRRKRSREDRHETASEEITLLFETPVENALDPVEIESALSQLPEDQRAVLHLKIWENYTFQQISEVLEISLNTAASRYRYALDKLREHLRPVYEQRND